MQSIKNRSRSFILPNYLRNIAWWQNDEDHDQLIDMSNKRISTDPMLFCADDPPRSAT